MGAHDPVGLLPVPAVVQVFATLTPWLALALPGLTASLLVTAAAFHVGLSPNLFLVATVLIVPLTTGAIGYAEAVALPAQLSNPLSALLLLLVMFFSPINFPSDRLPSWLAAVQDLLPFGHMADLMRYSLTGTAWPGAWALVVIGGWFVASSYAAWWAATRRR
jgi:ABC-type polysaccharide/polyol phosphate export permease